MTESVLKALMRLFAMVSQALEEEKYPMARAIVESYLRQLINPNKLNQYLIMYDFYLGSQKDHGQNAGAGRLSSFSVKALIICEQINQVLQQRQKALVLLQLFEIINLLEKLGDEELDFVKTIALELKFSDNVYLDSKAFILDKLEDIPDKGNVLVIDSKPLSGADEINHLQKKYLKGQLIFLYQPDTHTVLFRHVAADDQLYLNGRKIIPYRTYILEKGSTIRSPIIGQVYYSDITKIFSKTARKVKIRLEAQSVSYEFSKGKTGIFPVNFSEESGNLLGIMGGSGVGKSTLLNILNGNLNPTSGKVLINGYDVHKEREALEGVVGFIPQDDLLIEELSIYQNLYFNARLCFKGATDEELTEIVNRTLKHFDLYNEKDLIVGNPLNKFISGGQRKRLNIALELIREPYVLFVDEPTSGLSSIDSETVIDLLKDQTRKGRLVIINIHQPSSDIFKQLDKLLVMDRGGRTVYYGNPLDALVYFKTQNQLINAEESECLTCGNVNPEQILQIIEARKVDEFGEFTSSRIVSADEWYQLYKKNIEKPAGTTLEIKTELPASNFKIPGKWKQFKVFSLRNLFTKIADKQYLLINLLEAPLLAVILGYFTRYNAGNSLNPNAYVFSENVNLPVYLFMSVIVALFLGLMVSAEDIIRDRKLIQRESFLHLSRFSYIHSKIILLLVLSLIQTFLFVLIGNSILEIKGMFTDYWLMLFSIAVFANLLGLNISDSLKSVVSIYILIPLLLVPQILLGGAMIRFDKLNKKMTTQAYVPIIGDLMASRWGYEALAVDQFLNNRYQENLDSVERAISDVSFKMNYLIPELQTKMDECNRNILNNRYQDVTQENLQLLSYELKNISNEDGIQEFTMVDKLTLNSVNSNVFDALQNYLTRLKSYYSQQLDVATEKRDDIVHSLAEKLGGQENLYAFKQEYYNNSLADLVLKQKDSEKIVEYKNKLIRKAEPVYFLSVSKWGRSHFFAPEKKLGNVQISTFWFNVLVIWLMSGILYIALGYRWFNKFMHGFASVSFKNFFRTEFKSIQKTFQPWRK